MPKNIIGAIFGSDDDDERPARSGASEPGQSGGALSDPAAAPRSIPDAWARLAAENKRLDDGRLARENARRTALGQEPLTSIEQLDDTATSDAILLHQAAQITAEIAEKRPGQ